MKVEKVNSDDFSDVVLKSDKPVLLDFNAEWCGPCRMLGPILEEFSKDCDDVKFVSINVDENEELAAIYNVSSIPCLVLIKDGIEVKRHVGFMQKDEIERFIF